MILEKQTEGLILEKGVIQESTSMEIDAESHIFLMRMLSKFYSDAVGSTVRETVSNALDSHRHMGITEPIIVSLNKRNGNYEFSVEDFGMGMDSHVIENVIKKYGKSTKRDDAKALGAFGLGFKSPLAYGPSFYFIGRKDGIERKWMMYEAEGEENKIDLLYESTTAERNGVKVIVPVKYGDQYNFTEKIKEQLAYFEHVYFDVEGIENDFNIIRHKDFQWSPLVEDNSMHICLDDVYYPLDFAKLGIKTIYVPVALRFGLNDKLFPLPNRETLKYTPEAKSAILVKIREVADYFVTNYNKKIVESKDIFSIFHHMSTLSRNVDSLDGQNNWEITELALHASIPFKLPTLTGVKHIPLSKLYSLRDQMVGVYERTYDYRNKRFTTVGTSRYNRQISFWTLEHQTPIYLTSENMTKTRKDYFRDLLTTSNAIFVKHGGELPLKIKKGLGGTSLHDLLELHKYPRNLWREVIKEYHYVRSLATVSFRDGDVVIPDTWIEGRKKAKLQIMAVKGTNVRRKKLLGEVTGREAKSLGRYVSGKQCKFESTVIKMPEAHRSKVFTIYGNSEIETKVQQWFTVLKQNKVRFVAFSERELKNLKDLDLHNWMTMEEFEKGEHIIFKRAATAFLIKQLQIKNSTIFNKSDQIAKISEDLASKINTLNEYVQKYYLNGDQELYKSILAVAESKNLFDPNIYPLYKEMSKTLSKLPFLNPIFGVFPSYGSNQELIEVIKDLFKYYRMRIDWVHYKVKLNEDVVEPMLEEELEDII